jgi:dipeptidase E
LPVVGLREGDMLRSENNSVVLKGTKSARIFRRGQQPFEVPSGSRLDSYVQGVSS